MKKMDLQTLGKLLMLVGLVVAVVGGGLWVMGRAGIPLGPLPGDLRWEGNGVSVYLPITTSIVLSVTLTLILNLILRLLRK